MNYRQQIFNLYPNRRFMYFFRWSKLYTPEMNIERQQWQKAEQREQGSHVATIFLYIISLRLNHRTHVKYKSSVVWIVYQNFMFRDQFWDYFMFIRWFLENTVNLSFVICQTNKNLLLHFLHERFPIYFRFNYTRYDCLI